jgi:hydroxypyruvate reductase
MIADVLMDNEEALNVAGQVALEMGFRVEICRDLVEGDYQAVADELIERLTAFRSRQGGAVCLVSGGEVSCEVGGNGAGGRNQHFVLYSAARLEALGTGNPTAVLSCGTDGIDGNSPAAGAVAGEGTAREARLSGLDPATYLQSFDSYTFFRKFGGVVVTGPTGNNVRDIRILLAGP